MKTKHSSLTWKKNARKNEGENCINCSFFTCKKFVGNHLWPNFALISLNNTPTIEVVEATMGLMKV